jgi:ABC-type phosphate/phosphonate transport system ATPase subunit
MSGDKPWPEVPIGNKDHTNAAVVIIGAGISGKSLLISPLHRTLPTNSNSYLSLQASAQQSTSSNATTAKTSPSSKNPPV